MSTRLNPSRRLSAVLALAAAGLLTAGAASAFAASSVTYNTSAGGSSLNITGEADADLITVSVSGNTITITDTGPGGITTADADCAVVNANTVTCPLDPPDNAPPAEPFPPVDQISAGLLAGDDTFTSGAPIDMSTISGDDGNDNLQTGSGNDNLDGDEGNDTLNGGDGNDDLDDGHTAFGTGGTDTLIGGNGRDSASGNTRELPTTISIDGAANDGFPSLGEADNYQVEEFDGGQSDDTLVGDSGLNGIQGRDGNDTVLGGGGVDTVAGGEGDDQLDPGAGADDVRCGAGLDTALLTPGDVVGIGDFGTPGLCERTGAEISGESVTAKIKGKGGSAKVKVNCGADEGATCTGKVVLKSNGKTLTKKGSYKVPAGQTKNAKLKLTKKGAKKLDQAGGNLLLTAETRTTYPLGTSVKEEQVMLIEKSGK